MITLEEYRKMQNAIEDASEDETPYLAPVDNELHMVGDPNKTEIKPHDYKVEFLFPKNGTFDLKKYLEGGGKVIKESDNYWVVEREYKNIFVPVRRHSSVINAFTRVEQFLMMVTDDGTVRELEDSEVYMILQTLDDEIVDAVCDAVAKVLNLTPFEAQCIKPTNAMRTIAQMMADMPEVLNEADYFFA